jgi:hypothetical protein
MLVFLGLRLLVQRQRGIDLVKLLVLYSKNALCHIVSANAGVLVAFAVFTPIGLDEWLRPKM